tara:strand:+ start:1484 stop:1918 length:435 start_codon:yes stop_codon:yes gene_type:complete
MYKINDVLIHKNSNSKWIITSKDYKYNDNNLIVDKFYNLYQYNNDINYNKNMVLNELELYKLFIKKDNYRTYQSQNRLKILFYYINHYNNDLSPEFIKIDNNYIYYKLDKKDYIKEFLINDIIDYSNLDLIYKAKNLVKKYNNK